MKRPTALLTLTFFLAACGGTAPPPEPPPVTEPGIPVAPVVPIEPVEPTPPEQPISDVPHYGEWYVTFTTDSGVDFTHTLNITERFTEEGLQNGGFGLQRLCIEEGADPCEGSPNYAGGFGFIGNLELDDGTAPLSLAIADYYSWMDEPELKVISIEDLQRSTNFQGQEVLEGRGYWFYFANRSDDGSLGTVVATKVGAPRQLESVSPANVKQLVTRSVDHFTHP